MTFTITIAVLLVLVGFADNWTTMRVLKVGGVELNPLIRRLMRRYPKRWQLAKVMIHVVLAVVVLIADRPWATLVGTLVFVFLALAVAWNLNNYRRIKAGKI